MCHVSKLSFDEFIREIDNNIAESVTLRETFTMSSSDRSSSSRGYKVIEACPISQDKHPSKSNIPQSKFDEVLTRLEAAKESNCMTESHPRRMRVGSKKGSHKKINRYLLVECPLCTIPIPMCLPPQISVSDQQFDRLRSLDQAGAFPLASLLFTPTNYNTTTHTCTEPKIPISIPSVGLMVHWNRYSETHHKRELKEFKRCRRQCQFTVSTSGCVLCGL